MSSGWQEFMLQALFEIGAFNVVTSLGRHVGESTAKGFELTVSLGFTGWERTGW